MAGDPTESQHATFIARWDRCEVGRVTLVQQPAGFPSEIPFGLFALYVRPAARGCGIGTLLCRSLLADASVGGPVTVGLLVDADNATAITLYTRLGFIAIGNSIDPTNWPLEYDASGRHLLLMVHRGDSTA